MSTTHADAETAMMRDGVAAHRAAIKRHVDDVGHAAKAVNAATDLVETFKAAGMFVVACEGLEDAVAETIRKMREYLAARMSETGATTVSTDSHTFGLMQAASSVVIVNAALVPPELMSTPKPSPDKTAIAKLLRSGNQVAGTELSNGGPTSLVIRNRKP